MKVIFRLICKYLNISKRLIFLTVPSRNKRQSDGYSWLQNISTCNSCLVYYYTETTDEGRRVISIGPETGIQHWSSLIVCFVHCCRINHFAFRFLLVVYRKNGFIFPLLYVMGFTHWRKAVRVFVYWLQNFPLIHVYR